MTTRWPEWLKIGAVVYVAPTGDPDCDDLEPWTVAAMGVVQGEAEVMLTCDGGSVVARWPLSMAAEFLTTQPPTPGDALGRGQPGGGQ